MILLYRGVTEVDIPFVMDGIERQRVQAQVDNLNKSLNGGREIKSEMDKDDFLNILITQLTHQDPTQPLEDKEFVAQMAQFSTLEQMTNMNSEFEKLSRMLTANQAVSLLGKQVEIIDNGRNITGVVEAVSGGDFPQLMVDGEYFDYGSVSKIME